MVEGRQNTNQTVYSQGAHTLFVKFLNKRHFFCISTCLSSVDFGELCLTVHRTASSCRYAKDLTFKNEKYRIFSIKPPGGLIYFKHLRGGGLNREGGLINLTEYCRCDSISLSHLSSPLMRRTRIFSFYYSQYHAILNKNCFEKYNLQ